MQNFEYLWQECNDKYAFFEYKKVDWQKVHAKYKSIISEDLSDDLFFNLMRDMLNELKDGHVNLKSSFNISRYDFSSQANRSFDFQLIQKKYISTTYYTTGPFVHDFLKNNPDIGYIRFASFTGTVTDYDLNFILNKYANTKGLIIDIRGNSGGVINDLYTILSHFVTQKTEIWQSQIRNGKSYEDFSPLQSSYLFTQQGITYLKKVIILTNKGTYSAGSFFALASKALPNMLTLGEDTGGGLGLPNGGQLPNGWTYRFSVTRTLDLKGNNYEDGVPVNIAIVFDANNNPSQKDAMIDAAVTELNK